MQLTHSYEPVAALAGQVEQGPNTFVDSGVCKEENGIAFGLAVVNVASDTNSPTYFESPDATGEVTGGRIIGVAVRDESKPFEAVGYVENEMMPVMTRGRVWVKCETAMAKGLTPFVRFSAAGAEELGAFRNDADTSDAVAMPNARVIVPAAAAGICLIEIS